MASIPTLFNLDPTQFALGRSTGKFRGLVEAPQGQSAYDLGELLKSIKQVGVERPGEFNAEAPEYPDIPKFTVATPTTTLPDAYKNRNIAGEYAAAVKAKNTAESNYNKALDVANKLGGSPALGTYYNAYVNATNVLNSISSLYNTYGEESARYNKEVADYKDALAKYNSDYAPQLGNYKKELTDYTSKVTAYKKQIDAYNAEVSRWQKDAESQRNVYQRGYLNQDVADPNILATGQELAASSLYSDALHQEMLNRISEANAGTVPGSDTVTSLYSTK